MPAQAQGQVTSRTVVVTQNHGYRPGFLHLYGSRTVTSITTQQTIAYREPPRLPGSVTSFEHLPEVTGIRAPPVAPPTVYRIEGPRTAMHEAYERRMREVNPGARVVTPDDLGLSRETRRRYAVARNLRPREFHPREMRQRRVSVSEGVMMPQVIIVRPSRTY